jgi:hypothetical protein
VRKDGCQNCCLHFIRVAFTAFNLLTRYVLVIPPSRISHLATQEGCNIWSQCQQKVCRIAEARAPSIWHALYLLVKLSPAAATVCIPDPCRLAQSSCPRNFIFVHTSFCLQSFSCTDSWCYHWRRWARLRQLQVRR